MGNNTELVNQPDKFILIYEINSESPLFAYAADKTLKAGNVEKAIDILEKGLAKYPDYPTAYLIYAKVLAAAGKKQEAYGSLGKAAALLGYDESGERYKNLVNEIFDTRIQSQDKTGTTPDKFEATTSGNEKDQTEFEDNLEILAKELETAKIKAVDIPAEVIEKHKKLTDSNNKIITETLAGIYLDQNVWDKALEIYKELINIRPEKAGFYRQKIARIEEIIAKRKKD